MNKKTTLLKVCYISILGIFFFVFSIKINAQVVLETEVKITDIGLHFDGSKVSSGASNTGDNAPYDYFFGRNISAHGDCIKTYNNYVFMTWYRGGKGDRHVMLSRYNTVTGTLATIEFPHRHTGYQNKYWIGESHNTIAVGVSPLNGTIHLLYDMHAYSASRPSNGSLANDYFRYSYSVPNVATVPDADFTLDKFVQNSNGGYKHLRMPGSAAQSEFVALTYPKFFLNDGGDLFVLMREGGNNNGMYKFTKYNAGTGNWSNFTDFNALNARSQPGINYNWGLYGNMKYVNGKIRIGFQRRSQNNNDKYQYQNGVYYAYSDNQDGVGGWKNHQGQSFTTPLYDADFIKVMEPGDYVQTTQANKVHIVGSFDWTVTENGDVHIISRVKDNQYNVTKYLHTYKPAGASDFITSEDFAGAGAIYTAGNDIFIIGLKNSRIFIQKAQGGTNNFTTVYQATSGRTFDHGRVHINNGKLYYYLMENKSGNAQPLYLQIIDLDIDIEPFRVSLTSPYDGETFMLGETVPISANAVDENGSISKIEFRVNDAYFGEDTTAPFSVDWTPSTEGTHNIQAIAYNANNETVSSNLNTITIKINDPTDLTGDVYRIKNLATGKYLKASSGQSTLVESDYVEDLEDLEFRFLATTHNGNDYYSIDPKKRGVLRATGSAFSTPYAVISSSAEPPNQDSDKVWTVYYNQLDGTYRFEARESNRYLYHQSNGAYYNILADANDNRSKWIVESTTLSTDINEHTRLAVKVFPNPTSRSFTVALNGMSRANIIIYDILGNMRYMTTTTDGRLVIENNGNFTPGVYLIKVVDDLQRTYNKKLVIR
ncbi:T9SS type A sorting domain-containing protein [Hyunsoonleella flava]|uniref:T9SS type A sorting domain-containing protein n=1 Tax=Hyunsoonleella flava TaxID=2527939 RepID=A0A4Q9FF49_9FLAO|nr:BNR-4 repeat-containing protein [Hyunsoonleella flava]TBN02950.1 T9SS type A sorting domain-containing protein [Hyunsoonleella flava]